VETKGRDNAEETNKQAHNEARSVGPKERETRHNGVCEDEWMVMSCVNINFYYHCTTDGCLNEASC
jgi:hypothetical protein